jgi:hypothetical protein
MKTTTIHNKQQQPLQYYEPNEPYERRSVAIFCFCGAFKTKVPFSFVTFLFWASKKKSKEGEKRPTA